MGVDRGSEGGKEGLIPCEFIFNRNLSYCFGDKNRIDIRPRYNFFS